MGLPKFELVEKKSAFHDDHWCIRILDGEYAGLVYQYDVVKIGEEESDGSAVLTFNTITVENPNNCDLTEENDRGILGGILVEIIREQMEAQLNENGTSDTEQSPA
jgi:hypothetical protein